MSNSLPRLPIGISEFLVLREEGMNYLYVDKTRVLFQLLDAGKYLFLARPPAASKSVRRNASGKRWTVNSEELAEILIQSPFEKVFEHKNEILNRLCF